MKFHWKLLIFLLLIAVGPVLMLRTAGIRHLKQVANELTTRIHNLRLADAQNRFSLLVQGAGELLRASRGHVEAIVSLQADRARQRLVDNFALLPGTLQGPVHNNRIRLSDMDKVLASVSDPALRQQIIILQNGLRIYYPTGLSGDSAGDPRTLDWYRSAFDSDRIYWSDPCLNPATKKIELTVAKRFCRPDGTPVGVYAATVNLRRLLSQCKLLHHVMPLSSVYIVRPVSGSSPGIEIIAGGVVTPGGHIPCSASRFGQRLVGGNDALAGAMIRNLQSGNISTTRMQYREQECLWTYGPLEKPLSLVMITPVEEIFKPAAQSEHFVQRLIQKQMAYSYYILLGIIVAAVIITVVFSRTVTRPLYALVKSARRLGRGDFTARADVRSRDEFGDLARVFNSLGPKLQRISAMEHSLAVAAEVQENLLPQTDPSVDGLDVSGASIYCEEIGGDYFDYITFGDPQHQKFGVVIGDVSDHGIASALLMSSVRALLHERSAFPGCTRCDLFDINRQLCRDVRDTGRFMTLFYAEFDVHRSTICWTRAGHDPALLYDPENEHFIELAGEGIAMGVIERASWQEYRRPIEPGQVIVMATDGVWEAINPEGKLFGKGRLRSVIASHALQTAREIRDAVIDSVTAFRGPLKAEDDLTLVVIKVGHPPS